jgi:general secretion pathway protein J
MKAAGFTLLEIMVALVVFGLVLAGLNQGVRYGLQAWHSQVRLGSRNGDLDAVSRALRNMIEVMDPGNGVDPAPIAATRSRLAFDTVLPDSAGTGSVRRVTAELLVDRRHDLVLQWRPELHVKWLRPRPSPTVATLVGGVAGLDMSFWRPSGGWVENWNYPDLPALIRIRVVFPPGDLRHWPDLIAAPLQDRP